MPLALANEPHPAIPVKKIECWPGPVVPVAPGSVSVVLGDGKIYVQLTHRAFNVAPDALEAELGCVDPDNLQALRRVLRSPTVHIGQGPSPKDARVGAELDQHQLPTQVGQAQRPLGVEPSVYPNELRSGGGSTAGQQAATESGRCEQVRQQVAPGWHGPLPWHSVVALWPPAA